MLISTDIPVVVNGVSPMDVDPEIPKEMDPDIPSDSNKVPDCDMPVLNEFSSSSKVDVGDAQDVAQTTNVVVTLVGDDRSIREVNSNEVEESSTHIVENGESTKNYSTAMPNDNDSVDPVYEKSDHRVIEAEESRDIAIASTLANENSDVTTNVSCVEEVPAEDSTVTVPRKRRVSVSIVQYSESDDDSSSTVDDVENRVEELVRTEDSNLKTDDEAVDSSKVVHNEREKSPTVCIDCGCEADAAVVVATATEDETIDSCTCVLKHRSVVELRLGRELERLQKLCQTYNVNSYDWRYFQSKIKLLEHHLDMPHICDYDAKNPPRTANTKCYEVSASMCTEKAKLSRELTRLKLLFSIHVDPGVSARWLLSKVVETKRRLCMHICNPGKPSSSSKDARKQSSSIDLEKSQSNCVSSVADSHAPGERDRHQKSEPKASNVTTTKSQGKNLNSKVQNVNNSTKKSERDHFFKMPSNEESELKKCNVDENATGGVAENVELVGDRRSPTKGHIKMNLKSRSNSEDVAKSIDDPARKSDSDGAKCAEERNESRNLDLATPNSDQPIESSGENKESSTSKLPTDSGSNESSSATSEDRISSLADKNERPISKLVPLSTYFCGYKEDSSYVPPTACNASVSPTSPEVLTDQRMSTAEENDDDDVIFVTSYDLQSSKPVGTSALPAKKDGYVNLVPPLMSAPTPHNQHSTNYHANSFHGTHHYATDVNLPPVVCGDGYNNTQFYYQGCLSGGYGGRPVLPEASGYGLFGYPQNAYNPQPTYQNMIFENNYPGTAALPRSANLSYYDDDPYYLPSAYPLESCANYECAEPIPSSETVMVDGCDRANLKVYDEVTQTWRSNALSGEAASKKPDFAQQTKEIKMIDEFLVSIRNKKTKAEALARAKKSRDDRISDKQSLSGDASSKEMNTRQAKEIDMIDEFLESLRNKKTRANAFVRAKDDDSTKRRKRRDDVLDSRRRSGDASSKEPKSSHPTTKDTEKTEEFLVSTTKKRTEADSNQTIRPKRRDDTPPKTTETRRKSRTPIPRKHHWRESRSRSRHREDDLRRRHRKKERSKSRSSGAERRPDRDREKRSKSRSSGAEHGPDRDREKRSKSRSDLVEPRSDLDREKRSKSRSSGAEHRPDRDREKRSKSRSDLVEPRPDIDREKRSKSRSDLVEPRPDLDREKRSKSRSDLVEPRSDLDREKHSKSRSSGAEHRPDRDREERSKSRSNLVEPRPDLDREKRLKSCSSEAEPRPDLDREKRSKSRSNLVEPRPGCDWVEEPSYHSYRDDRSTRSYGGGKKRLKSRIIPQPVRSQKPVVKDLAVLIASRRATLVSDRLMEEQKRVAGEKLRKLAFRPHRLLGFDRLVTEEQPDDCILEEPEIPVVDLSDYESTEETTSHEVGTNLIPLSAIKVESESSDDESGGPIKEKNPVVEEANNVERPTPPTIPTSTNEDCSRPDDDASRSVIVEESGTSQQECSSVTDVNDQPTEECVQETVDDQPTEECVEETVDSDQHIEEGVQEIVDVQRTEERVQEIVDVQRTEERVQEIVDVQRTEECVQESEIRVTESNASTSQLEKEPGEIDDDIISLSTYNDSNEGSENELPLASDERLWVDLECELENENRNYWAKEDTRRPRSPMYSPIDSDSDPLDTPRKKVDLGEHLPGRYRYTYNSKRSKQKDDTQNEKHKKQKKKRKRSSSRASGLVSKKCRNRAAENSRPKSPIAKEPRDPSSLDDDNLTQLEEERKRLLRLVEEPNVKQRKKLLQKKDELAEEHRDSPAALIENLIHLVKERKQLLQKKNKLTKEPKISPSSEFENLIHLIEERKRLLWEKDELIHVSKEVRKEASEQVMNVVALNVEEEIEEQKISSPKHVSIPGFCTCATEEMSEVERCLFREMKRFEDELKTASLHYVAKSLQCKIDEIKNELANDHICDVRANNFDIAKCHCTASRVNATVSYCICEKEELERLKYRLQLLLEVSDDGQRREWLQNMMKDTERRLLKYL